MSESEIGDVVRRLTKLIESKPANTPDEEVFKTIAIGAITLIGSIGVSLDRIADTLYELLMIEQRKS